MKVVLYCQQQRCNPMNVLFNITFLALICLGYFARDLRTAASRFPLAVGFLVNIFVDVFSSFRQLLYINQYSIM